MAIRNVKLSGTDFSNGEVLYNYDLDDTNNTIINLFKSNSLTKLGFYDFNFVNDTSSNVFNNTIADKISIKTTQGSSFSWESTYENYISIPFNAGILSYETFTFGCSDGTTTIFDNFDDGTIPTFWTDSLSVTSAGVATSTESSGYWQLYSQCGSTGDTSSASSVSGDLKGTDKTYIIILNQVVSSNQSGGSANANFQIGSSTDATWYDVFNNGDGSTISSNKEYKIIINNNSDVLSWIMIDESNTVTSGSQDLSSATDINFKLSASSTTNATPGYISTSYIQTLGIYEHKTTSTSTVNVQLSNDGGSVYDTVSDSGYIQFTAENSNLGLKISGTSASNEVTWVNVNNFRRLE